MKFNIFIYILLVQGLSSPVSAQSTLYFNKYIGNFFPFVEHANSSVQITDSTYYTSYADDDLTLNSGSMYLMHLDKEGDSILYKKFTEPFGQMGFEKIIILNDSIFYGVGANLNNITDTVKFYLVKFNANCDTVWTKVFSNGQNECHAYDIILTSDSNLVFSGFSATIDSVTHIESNIKGYVVKSDLDGNLIWSKSISFSNDDVELVSLAETASGDLLLTGVDYVFNNNFEPQGIIVKCDGFGNVIWYHLHGLSSQYDGFSKIKKTLDGNYILTGGINPCPNNCGQCWLYKTTDTDNLIWQKYYFLPVQDSYSNDVVELNDSTLIFTGVIKDTVSQNYIGFTMKCNSQGDSIWFRSYGDTIQPYSYFYDILPTLDNGFLMTGVVDINDTLNPSPNFGGNAWYLKVDSMGCKSSGCFITGINEYIPKSFEKAIVYPNPTNSNITLKVSSELISSNYMLINAMGQILSNSKINQEEMQLDLSSFTTGLYYLLILSNTGDIIKLPLVLSNNY